MGCSQTLKHIQQECGTSQGGIVKAWLTPFYNASGNPQSIFTVSADTEGNPYAISAITSGVSFYTYDFRKGTGSMTSTLNVDEANGINYVSTEVILQFNKMETNKRAGVAALALGGVAGFVKDSNNKYWALGVSEAMMASAGSAQTGQAKTDGNFYQITLKDDYQSFPLEIPAAIAEAVTIAE